MATGMGDPPGFTVHELARAVGMTARNIRAHQQRGLLPPPVLRGRQAYYGPTHVHRLQLVRMLQDAGFNLAAIERLVSLDERYAQELLQISRAVSAREAWDGVLSEEGLAAIRSVDAEALGWMEEAGILRREPDGRLVVANRQLAYASEALYRAEVPLAELVRLEREAVECARALAVSARPLARDSETTAAVVSLLCAVLQATLAGAVTTADAQT